MERTIRILLVDDDIDDQLYFQDALKEVFPDAIFRVASNGNEGLQEIATYPLPDLIFMDLNMPVMNGYECLSILKMEPRSQDIPVVIFTTSKNKTDIEKSKELGASFFLSKPTEFKTLCNKLTQIINYELPASQFIV